MNSGRPLPWLRSGTETNVYTLPPGADVAARVGEHVHAGDTLATLPPLPHIIAFSESLRLSLPAGKAAIQALDGAATAAGDVLGRHRTGLRARAIPAPCSGAIRGVPDLGTIAILPANERQLLRADCPGVVAAIDLDRITITAQVVRCRAAYTSGAGTTFGRFTNAPTGGDGPETQQPDVGGNDVMITAIPHIATVADFTAALRSARGPIIVGTVSEAVAWEMLARPTTQSVSPGHVIAVLIGPGDSAVGERVIEQLRGFDGAMLALAPQSGEMTIYPKCSEGEQWAEDANDCIAGDARYLDPARWQAACVVEGEAQVGLLGTGARTGIIRTEPGDGSAGTPVVNIAKYPVS